MLGLMILPLGQTEEAGLIGGKAHALSRLIDSGFVVPPGFVLTTNAFLQMTPQLEAAVLKSFDTLDSKYVAVRSSAVAEDGGQDAWAGQLDTFLNVSRNNILESIEKCWESAGSARAKAYARQKNLKTGPVAVVVQAMIQGRTSGIAFSSNPVNADSKQMIIEAGYGLNEPIVSGQITPDTYVFDKRSGLIIEKHLSLQTKKYVKGAGGSNEWRPLKNGEKQKITDGMIKEIAAAVQRLEAYFGFPVDVEWTVAKNKLYILQSRPITTLG